MKKSLLFIAALFVAAMASAQLQLIKSFDGAVYPSTIGLSSYESGDWQFPSQYVYSDSFDGTNTVINFYDGATLDFYKSVTIEGSTGDGIIAASKNFFSTDGKLMFMIYQNHNNVLFDEDGKLVQTFLRYTHIYKNLNGYILATYSEGMPRKTEFYAIPGDIEPTAITNTPAQSPRAIRKAIRKGQVIVNTPEHDYTVNGQTLK